MITPFTARIATLTVLAVFALPLPIMAGEREDALPAARLFGQIRTPAPGRAEAIGSYARGCLKGAVALPETGPSWQVMRPSRGRNWGHPATIAFIERLSRKAAALGWKGLYIGDIGQPRGGPIISSHRSHQTGLDVDIWFRPATRLDLSRRARERLSPVALRSADQKRVTGAFTPAHMAILKAAAEDPAVDRIFVAAAIKLEMCRRAKGDRRWLQKIRPLYGHAAHFHVRLKCPPGNWRCKPQRPTVAQLSKSPDGCDATLRWWVTEYLELLKHPPKPKRAAKRKRRKRAAELTLADLPRACRAVLTAR